MKKSILILFAFIIGAIVYGQDPKPTDTVLVRINNIEGNMEYKDLLKLMKWNKTAKLVKVGHLKYEMKEVIPYEETYKVKM